MHVLGTAVTRTGRERSGIITSRSLREQLLWEPHCNKVNDSSHPRISGERSPGQVLRGLRETRLIQNPLALPTSDGQSRYGLKATPDRSLIQAISLFITGLSLSVCSIGRGHRGKSCYYQACNWVEDRISRNARCHCTHWNLRMAHLPTGQDAS